MYRAYHSRILFYKPTFKRICFLCRSNFCGSRKFWEGLSYFKKTIDECDEKCQTHGISCSYYSEYKKQVRAKLYWNKLAIPRRVCRGIFSRNWCETSFNRFTFG